MTTETCTGQLRFDGISHRWFVQTQLVGAAYLANPLQSKPDPTLQSQSTDVEVMLTGAGPYWECTDYHFA